MVLSLTSGLLLGLTAGFSPGPLLTLVITQTLHYGVKEGVKIALAPLITDLPIIFLAFWLAAWLTKTTWPLGIISMAGAGYVIYLAWGSWHIHTTNQDLSKISPNSLKKGIWVNLLNPHPYLFWIMVGAALIQKAWAISPWAAILWVVGFYVTLVGSKLILAIIVGQSLGFLGSQTFLWINRGLSLLLLLFSLILLKDAFRLFIRV